MAEPEQEQEDVPLGLEHESDPVEDSGQKKTTGGDDETYCEVTVTDPVKQGEGMSAHITYQVSMKTNMPQFRNGEATVIRRFSDFVWLWRRLSEENPGIILPPLPEKNAAAKVFNMSENFLESRRRALESFLKRVIAHPDLQENSELQLFLEAADAFASDDKVSRMSSSSGGTGWPQSSSRFITWFKDVQQSTARALNVGGSSQYPAWEKTKQYYAELESYLSDMSRQVERYLKRQQKLASSLSSFSEALLTTGGYETSLTDAFTAAGNRGDEVKAAIVRSSDSQFLEVDHVLKEAVRYMNSVRSALNDRNNTLIKKEACKAEVQTLDEKLRKARRQGDAKASKVEELERELQNAKVKSEEATQEFRSVSERVEHELAQFQLSRAKELISILRQFASEQARLYKENANIWRSLIAELSGREGDGTSAHVSTTSSHGGPTIHHDT